MWDYNGEAQADEMPDSLSCVNVNRVHVEKKHTPFNVRIGIGPCFPVYHLPHHL